MTWQFHRRNRYEPIKKSLITGLILLALGTHQIVSGETPLLSFDKYEITKDGLPRNFRDLSAIGVDAIASAQFSENELKEVRKKYPNNTIVIVDLRQESHGFINGKSVFWRSYFEKINQNKTISNILSDEKSRLDTAEKDKKIIINTVAKRNRSTGWYSDITPQKVTVNHVMCEKELAEENGFEYQRFSIGDFNVPDEKEFLRIVHFIKTLPAHKKIYVHCAGGRGRTGLFLVTLDIIKNGNNASLQDIIKRQHQLGSARLDDISEEEAWNKEIAQKRLNLLEDFYQKSKELTVSEH